MNLINSGIVVSGDTVSIQFAVNGDATTHTCRMDRRQTQQCKSVSNVFAHHISVLVSHIMSYHACLLWVLVAIHSPVVRRNR